jgi:FkbM family methyltransferase
VIDVRRAAAVALGHAGRRYTYPGQRALSLVARGVRRFPPAGEIVYTDADGYTRTADLRDHMESLVFVGRHRLPKAAMAAVRSGDWAVDIGANVGSVAGQLCRAVGDQGLVWAFEPIPRNLDRLHALASVNALSQLRIFPSALSSATGTATIRLAGEGSSGHASFTASWIDKGELEVRTERLDDLTAEVDDNRPLRLVKLDVEGFEQQVLEGAEATLRRFRPLVYCEFNDITGYRPAPGYERASRSLPGRNVDLLMTPT